MKKTLSILIFIVILFLTGCGVKVTRIENTSASPAETLSFTDYETSTVPAEEPVTEPSAEQTTTEAAVTESVLTEKSTADPVKAPTTGSTTAVTPSTTKRQWTTRLYAQPETGTTVPTSAPSSTTARYMTGKYTQSNIVTCSMEIECKTILNNEDKLKEEKKPFVPANGYILKKTTVSMPVGSTVFDALVYVCENNMCSDNCEYCRASGIQLEYIFTPVYGSEYIRGIHQIYEKDCGTRSGWMYSVNGVFPNYGCNKYTLKNGDRVKFSYTCAEGDLK